MAGAGELVLKQPLHLGRTEELFLFPPPQPPVTWGQEVLWGGQVCSELAVMAGLPVMAGLRLLESSGEPGCKPEVPQKLRPGRLMGTACLTPVPLARVPGAPTSPPGE